MVWLDEHGRLFGKINVVNFLFFVIIISLVYQMIKSKPNYFNYHPVQATVIIKVNNVPDYYIDYLRPKSGQLKRYIWDQRNDQKLGELAQVSEEPVPDQPGRVDLTMVIKGDARYQQGKELRLGSRTLYLGQELPFKTDVCSLKGRILSIDWPGRQ